MDYEPEDNEIEEYASGLKSFLPTIKDNAFVHIFEAAQVLQGLVSDDDVDVTADDMFRLIFKEAYLRGFEDSESYYSEG